MAPFALLPAVREDLREIVEVFFDAFAEDGEVSLMYKNCDMKEVVAADLKDYEAEWDTPGRRFFKVVDQANGRIAATSKWWYPYTLTPEQTAAGVGVDKLPESWPTGINLPLSVDFLGKLFDSRRRLMDHENEYFLNILAVRREYQRQGLGTMLLDHGLKLPDKDGLRTYIEGTPKGVGLYRRYGWKDVEDLVIDTRPYGGKIEITKCMRRDPKPVTA